MKQRKINIIIAVLVVLLLFVLMFDRIVKINGPAVRSIVFKPFNGGIDVSKTIGEGLYFVWPWNTVYKFSIREQSVTRTINIMVANGITVTLRVNYRYFPVKDSLPVIFRRYGVNYPEKFVFPEVLAAVREQFSDKTPQQIYDTLLQTLEKRALYSAKNRLSAGDVNISDLVLLDIKMPKRVVAAIEDKLREEQLVQQYDLKVEVAEREKKIKIIDASAIKMAEDTINEGLTPSYLQFKQIEAFLKLSVSQNAKTIIIPPGTKYPFLFNGQ